MQNILRNVPSPDRSATPWILLLMLAGYTIVGLFVFQFIGLILILPFVDFDFEQVSALLTNPMANEQAKVPLLVIQGVTSLGAFVLVPYFFIIKNLNLTGKELVTFPKAPYTPILMTVMVTFGFMVVNSIVIEWNQNLKLPESLAWFEEMASSKEQLLKELTEYLTRFNSFSQFLIGFLVIAILPAIGEELLFRGLVQNLFNKIFKNAHLAIALSAFLFAAIHLQFYGLVPRFLLGVLFGYLYYFSGSLGLAMLGHFVNNGFTVTFYYLSQTGAIDISPNELEESPPMYIILIFFVVTSFFLYLFRNYFVKKEHA